VDNVSDLDCESSTLQKNIHIKIKNNNLYLFDTFISPKFGFTGFAVLQETSAILQITLTNWNITVTVKVKKQTLRRETGQEWRAVRILLVLKGEFINI
jgi:hypothetical protein